MKKKVMIGLLCIIFIALIVPTKGFNIITGSLVRTSGGSFDVANFPPVIEADEFIGDAGDLVTINVNAYDPNGGSVTVNFTSPLNSSGQWQSTVNDSGTSYTDIFASDGTLESNLTVAIKLRPYCGDGNCSSGETCSTCVVDCGTCNTPSGGGGGGRRPQIMCIEDWVCTDWFGCALNESQTRRCTDRSACGTTEYKPVEIKSCIYVYPKLKEEVTEEEIPLEEEPKKLISAITEKITGGAVRKISFKSPHYLVLIALLSMILWVVLFLSREEQRKKKMKEVIIILLIISILFAGIYFLGSGLVGLFIAKEGLIMYEQDVSWKINADQEFDFVITEHPEVFNLRTLRLSGSYVGNGMFRAYLKTKDGTKYLILDDEAVTKPGLAKITGLFVEECDEDGCSIKESKEKKPKEAKVKVDEKEEEKEEKKEEKEEEKEEKKEEKKAKRKKENKVEEKIMRIKLFEDECKENCLLPPGLDDTEYKIAFEVESGLLRIDEINYVLKDLTTAANMTNTMRIYTKINDDPSFDAVIDSVVLEDGTLTVILHHDSSQEQEINVEGHISYELSHEEAKAGEKVSLVVYGWDNDYFRIKIGREEIFAFGMQEEFGFNPEIKNANNDLVEYDIEFEDVDTRDIEKTRKIRKPTGLVIASAPGFKIKQGKYDIKVKPREHPIKSVVIHKVDISSNITEFIGVDDAPETGEFIEVYAIDPTRFNFTKATVTVVAKGDTLYKCKDWNFGAQSCGGSWELFKTGLIPGEEYTFVLTPDDPGFAEINVSAVEDSFVNEGSPTTNYDEDTNSLSVGRLGAAGNRLWTFIKFSTSGINGDFVANATLRLYAESMEGSSFAVEVYEVGDDSWNETTLIGNNMPSCGSLVASATPTAGNWADFDVSSFVSETLENESDDTVSFCIKGNAATIGSSNYYRFEDHENTRGSGNTPELNIVTGAIDIKTIWPANNSQHGDGSIIISYNVTSDNEIDSCSLINAKNGGNIIDTDDTITRNILQTFVNEIQNEGNYSFYINCTDIFGNLETSETTSFYVNESKVDVYAKIKDSNSSAIDVNISFSQSGEVKYSSSGILHMLVMDDGLYDISVLLSSHLVQSIDFMDVNLTTSRIKVVDIDNFVDNDGYDELYSIDPTAISFTNATVTITAATNDWLYKCKDWNFTTQTCYGNWSILKTDLVPGQPYNFTITADDPGFAEQPGSEGKDTHIRGGYPNRNYGAEGEIQVKGDQSQRSLIEFNLSDIPSSSLIENATLELYVTGKGTGSPVINIYRINNSWTEGTGTGEVTDDGATWNSRNGSVDWDDQGGDYDETIWANYTLVDRYIWVSFNITELVQKWVNGSYPNQGLMLKSVTSGTNIWKFASSDNINSTIRPKIDINYIASIPPNVTSIQITPATAYTNDNLNCSFVVVDEDAGDNLSVNYTWYNGTSAIITGTLNVTNGTQESIVLGSGNTSKNDVWNCSVLPYDETVYGTERKAAKTIQNSLPTAPGVDVLPNSPEDDDDLVASITTPSSDADDDAITYSYQWYKDEVLQPGQTTSTLSNLLTSPGEVWKCVITPNDGEGEGTAGEDNVTINGGIPEQTSSVKLISPSNASTWTTSNTVTFQYNVSNNVTNCSLVINNAVDQTDIDVTPNATQSFTKTLSNGGYGWSVNCTNLDNSTNSSVTWQLTVDYDSSGGTPSSGGGGGGGARRQCYDRLDNDGDGLIDWPDDPGCVSSYDDDEINIIEGCSEYWICSGWGECVDSAQLRVCTDVNNCGTIDNKPSETRGCTVEEIPETENVTQIPEVIPKVTGKTIEVLPYQPPNPVYFVPTILLLVTLIAIIALRKTKLPDKIKNSIALLHILLIITIVMLLLVSFLGTTITGLVPLEGINATNVGDITIGDPINTFVVLAAVIIIVISLILFSNKVIKGFKPSEYKLYAGLILYKITKMFKHRGHKISFARFLDKIINKVEHNLCKIVEKFKQGICKKGKITKKIKNRRSKK
ncbi:DNRLRE domain-containing protein [Candidatus Woesearchaeota archaeon]|nr:DNRLRE domain-containing protein [Candidatus Woesearchaeota archaeon]